jgi:hypothetical protein
VGLLQLDVCSCVFDSLLLGGRCEKLQVACDEATCASDRQQAALAKQVEANKVLDNDLKMM